jgi:hypothetical protein
MNVPICGWCSDGLCKGDGSDCSFRALPIPCACPCQQNPSAQQKGSTMPETTPQDHKAKTPGHRFTVKGKSFTLPPVSEDAANTIPGSITYAAIMDPEDQMAQMRLAFATLEAARPSDAALAALKSLSTKEMLEVVGEWMGESSGSSD